jgi:riboflavin transporter FmnP
MKANKIVYLGLLSAMSFILMATFSVPILLQAPYLRFEPSEILAVLAAILYGPFAGIIVAGIKDLLYLIFRAKSIFGPVADFIALGIFSSVIGIIYGKIPSRKGFLLACSLASILRVLLMIPVNIIILRMQFGMAVPEVMAIMLPAIIPFNIIKSGINSLGAYVIVEALKSRSLILPK